ncbi:MAG: hypothetical protein ACT4PK_00780, partial [Gammaproteobacteria bacterium]
MKRTCLVVLTAALTVGHSAVAYKQVTHRVISEYAVMQSALGDENSGVTAALGLGRDASDLAGLLPSTFPYRLTLTPSRLIQHGADAEDIGTRALRHFYDPQHEGKGLRYAGATFMSSPRWSLEDGEDHPDQEFSYKDAKGYLYKGLTDASKATRDRDLGMTFEALGHVIHHVQDMAQPQHVRNDVHCDEVLIQLFASSWLAAPVCPAFFAYRPSAYEEFTYRRGVQLPLSGYETVDYGAFPEPSLLWSNDFAGIAEFTSNNFVSVGRNFRREGGIVVDPAYRNPSATNFFVSRRQITDADLLGPQGPAQPLAGEILFVGTPVTDRYRPSPSLNGRTSTYSIFDSDLQQANGKGSFTLNRFNYAAANEFLLPRAAAYSAGLINYFFRGRIGIGLPEEGVYGIIDHATTNAAGQGFSKLKLKLSNASPGGETPTGETVEQTMHGGTLVAVAKYTLNSCYQPDLSGDFAVRFDTGEVINPTCSLDQYFAGEEQISQSAAILFASLDKAPAEFTFDFSNQPIPVNARDLRIQVVYTGQLGAEADGIAFGGRDISEPTHLMIYNNSDYYAVDGTFHTPAQIRASEALTARTQGLDIDPAALKNVILSIVRGKPVTEASGAVPVNGYVRVAVLADIDATFDLNIRLTFDRGGTVDSTFPGIWAATIDLRGEQAFITPLAIYRGPRTHFVDVVFKAN